MLCQLAQYKRMPAIYGPFSIVVGVSRRVEQSEQGPDGCIYAMRGGYTTAGVIYSICPPLNVNETNSPVQHASLIPNPSSSGTDLHVTLSSSENVTIDITDITGRKLSSVFSGNLTAKNHVFHIETSVLNNGNYLLNIRLSDQSRVLKMVVIKE